jgi:hypothetical protein
MFCETDSMAIVATPDGGDLIPALGGSHRLPDGTPAVKALSYQQVKSFAAVHQPQPPRQGRRPRPVEARAGRNLLRDLRQALRHLPPRRGRRHRDPQARRAWARRLPRPVSIKAERRDARGNRIWIDDAWRWILAAHNNPDAPLPAWADRPAISRITISSPALWRPSAIGQKLRRCPPRIRRASEYKFNGPDGQPCRRSTRGILQRRQVDLTCPVRLIGKEANNIDEPQAGRYAQLGEIVAEYHNPTDDHFHLHVMPLFDYLSGRELARLVGTDRRTIDRIRAGRTPRRELRQALTQLAEGLRRDYLAGQRPGVQGPAPVERGRGTRLGSRESR